MKLLLPIILSLGLVSCSQQSQQSAKSTGSKSKPFHEYLVTFAAVKIPDEILKQHGGSVITNNYDFGTIEDRYKFASYVLAHTNEFSFTTPTGNCLPLVFNGQSTRIRILLDPQQEEQDFDKYGIKTMRFDVGIDVREEDDRGNVGCDWSCNYLVHLKDPIGNSTDHGGGGAFGGGMLVVGKPDLTPLFQAKGVTLWELVELNRE